MAPASGAGHEEAILAGTLFTSGVSITATASQLESYDAIRHSPEQPGARVTLLVSDGGLLDLADELGATPAILAALSASGSTLVGGRGDDWIQGATGQDELHGGDGADALTGHNGTDSLFGGAGHDVLSGGADRDTLFGGAGNDELSENAGRRMDAPGTGGALFGGAGDDLAWLGSGTADGGAGRDTLVFGGDLRSVSATGFEILATEGGTVTGTRAQLEAFQSIRESVGLPGGEVTLVIADGGRLDLSAELGATGARITVAAAGALLFTGAGDDGVTGQGGADSLFGGAGWDVLVGQGGADHLAGGDDGDTLNGGDEGDRLFGGAGDDNLGGEAGDDRLDGGTGSDLMGGGAGDDRYAVDDAGDVVTEEDAFGLDAGGHDRVTAWVDHALAAHVEDLTLAGAAVAGTGNGLANVLAGTAGDNRLAGGDGDDRLSGGQGSDALAGDAGADLLYGGDGDDTLAGGAGRDTLFGGAGADVLIFDATALGAPDRLHDFASGEDRLLLSEATFGELGGATVDPAALAFGLRAADAATRLVYDQASGRLWFDADGSGAGAAVQIALLDPGAALAAGDLALA